MQKYTKDFFKVIKNTKFDELRVEYSEKKIIDTIVNALERKKRYDNKIFIVGNGASCSMASHFATDLVKNCGIMAESLNDGALLTCFANDFSFEDSYKEMLARKLKKYDMVICISSSGESPNIKKVLEFTKKHYVETLTFTAFESDNSVRNNGTWNIYCPASTYGMAESSHAFWIHKIIDSYLEKNG